MINQSAKQVLQSVTLTTLLAICSLSWQGCRRPEFDKGRELVNAVDSTNNVLQVLKKGADINRRSTTTFGWTPLISAIYNHKEDVVDLLLARGADANLTDYNGYTALSWAIRS